MDLLPEKPAPVGLAGTFAHRVATRDVPVPPPPPDQSAAAIEARLDHWLLSHHHLRDRRVRASCTQILLVLLARPEAATAALQAAATLGPRATARAMLRLEALGLTTWAMRVHTRCHRLTRAGEDALLPVVTGAAG